MKWLIASDIHGSEYYCRRLIEAYRLENADRMLLLGDLLYHGPRNDLPEGYAPKKVIEMLNSLKNEILCVRGNCEAEVDQMVLEFPVMADYALIPAGSRIIYATHGHIFNRDNLPPLKAGDILLYGHTHVPLCEVEVSAQPVADASDQQNVGIICMNPGSVSIPKNGSQHSYMTFEICDHLPEQGLDTGETIVSPKQGLDTGETVVSPGQGLDTGETGVSPGQADTCDDVSYGIFRWKTIDGEIYREYVVTV